MPDHQFFHPADASTPEAPSFEAAEALLAAGAITGAEAMFRALMEAAPADWRGPAGAARCARQRGDHAASLDFFTAAAADFPDHFMLQMERAADLQALNRFDEADAAYLAVIGLAPEFQRARLGYGDCARQRGDRRLALARFREAAAASPDDPQTRLEIAYELCELGALDAAEAAFHEVLATAPEPLAAVQGLALCARKRNDKLRALPWFRIAVALDPANHWLRLELADCLRETGRIAEAEATLHELLGRAPNHVQAFIALAVCARRRNDRAAALNWFRAAAAVEPDNLNFAAEIAGEQAELGQLADAEAGLRRILAAAPGTPRALLGLAHCAHQRGDHKTSLRWYQQAAALDPENPDIRLAIAADLGELGELDTAEASFREILGAAPGNIQALQGLAACAAKRGAPRAAISLLREAIAFAPQDPWLPINLAAQLRELGELDTAEQIYHRLLATAPDHTHAHIGLGQLARLRGDRPAALAHFTAACAVSPHDLSARLELAAEQRETGDIAAARRGIEAALERHPGNLHALMSLGQTERHAYRDEAALAAFQAAHQALPAHSEPLVEMAVQHRLLGRQSECNRLLAQALELNPRSVSALIRQSEQAMLTGDLNTAHALSLRAIAIEPSSIAAHLAAVECLARMAKLDEAFAMLAALQDARGAQTMIIMKHLALLRQSGDSSGALALARQATGDAPHDFQLAVERFHCEMLAGGDTEVAACLARLRPGATHQHASAARLHGILAEHEFRFADAIQHYDSAVAHNANDPGMQEDLVRCHLMMFDLDGARRHLRRYFEQTAYITRLQNKSQNISQSLYGQILDEFWLDAELTGQLQTLQGEPAQTRIAPITGLVLANPDSTAAAIGLMIALRQHGAFARRPQPPMNAPLKIASSAAPIPQTIVQFWDSDAIPEDVAALMSSWRHHNPRHTHRLFSDATARAYLREFFPPEVLRAYHRGDGPAQKSDIFRLAYFAREGGVYADADDRCLAPLDSIIAPHEELVLYQENICSAGNNFIAVRPRHPVLVAALHLAIGAINRGDTDNVWLATGPGLLTRALARHLAESWQTRGTMPSGITVLDRRGIQPMVASNCILGYKFSNRHWLNAVFSKRRSAAMATPE